MLIDITQGRLQLGRGDHLKLRGARGTKLTTVSGLAWITVDGEAADTIVSPDNSFVVPSDRLALVGPLFSALTLDVRGAPDTIRHPNWRCSRVGDWLRRALDLVPGHWPWRARGEAGA